MAKRISQETFNAVVLENINEFEMSTDEAVEDAIKQFEAQGVNLMMVIKDPKMFSEDGMNEQASVECKLSESMNDLIVAMGPEGDIANVNEEKLHNACTNIQEICKRGIAERCLATKIGANDILMNCILQTLGCSVSDQAEFKMMLDIKRYNFQTLNILLQTYFTYVESQPDVMSDHTGKAFVSLLSTLVEDLGKEKPRPEIILASECLLDIFVRFCFMHENNRQVLVKLGLAKEAINILNSAERQGETTNGLISRGCLVLRSLVADDDIRVAFGRSHEHCQVIVAQFDALPTLLSLLKKFQSDVNISSVILQTVGQLVVREEFCLKVSEMGGIPVVLEILGRSLDDGKRSPRLRSVLQLLKNLSGSDKVKVEIISTPGGASLVCEALERHLADPGICEAACLLVASLVLRYPDHGSVFVEKHLLHDLLARVMFLHEKVAQVQKSCGMVIRNVTSRCPDLRSHFLQAGIEALLRKALDLHSDSCRDEISYALRDLGCEVQLRELWTGTGRTLAQ